MNKQFPISEAKNKLPALVHAVEHSTAVQLTRHGKPVAMLLSIAQYKRLINQKKNFWATMTDFRESTDEKALLAPEEIFPTHRDKSPGRRVELK